MKRSKAIKGKCTLRAFSLPSTGQREKKSKWAAQPQCTMLLGMMHLTSMGGSKRSRPSSAVRQGVVRRRKTLVCLCASACIRRYCPRSAAALPTQQRDCVACPLRAVPSTLRSAVAATHTLGWPPRQLLGCIAHGVRGVLNCLAHHSTAADFSSCTPLLLQLPPPLLLDILRWVAARTVQRGSPAEALHTAPGAWTRRLTPSTRSTTRWMKDRRCLYCLLLCPRPSAPVQCAAASRALLVVAYAA